MAEAPLIIPTADTMPAASGAPVAPADAAAEGIFAGMLAQRLQPEAERGAERGAPPGSPQAAQAPTDRAMPAATDSPAGQESPLLGNALPAEDAMALPLVEGVEPADPDLPLAALDGLLSSASAEGRASNVDPLAETVSILPPATDTTDAPITPLVDDALPGVAPLATPGETPRSAAPLPPLGDSPAPASDGRTPPARPLSAAELKLAGLKADRAVSAAQPAARPASLGLGARLQGGEPLHSGVAGQAELRQQGSASPQVVNPVLDGETLSRQFQQQMDRLLATTRGTASGAAGAPLEKTDNGFAGLLDTTSTQASPLPAIGGADFRAATPLAAAPGLPVATVVGQPGWSAELGQRMVWLANQEIREAQIQLNPRHLGPIDVRIVYGDAQQLSVSFVAQNPAAREALDAALPRLREMFDQQGLNLADASVSQESFADRHGGDGEARDSDGLRHAAGRPAWADGVDDDAPPPSAPRIIAQGLIDAFA